VIVDKSALASGYADPGRAFFSAKMTTKAFGNAKKVAQDSRKT
jgi:NAD/NADP transhydrogenase beta subunit